MGEVVFVSDEGPVAGELGRVIATNRAEDADAYALMVKRRWLDWGRGNPFVIQYGSGVDSNETLTHGGKIHLSIDEMRAFRDGLNRLLGDQ